VAPDETRDDRGPIRAVEEHLTAVYGVVVDDVVMRAWGNQQVELSYLLLSAAITSSGGAIDEADLWAVARVVAFPNRGEQDDVPLAERLAARSTNRRPA
jgi:hypothetical protein